MPESETTHYSNEPSPRTLRTLVYAGHLTALTMVVTWIVMYIVKGSPYEHTWWIVLLSLFFGRAAAVGSGLSLHFSPFFLFLQASLAELALVLYIFPIFVVGYKHLTRIRYIGSYLDSLHKVALSYKSTIAPYGIVGLMLFVIFPFWSTGPVVGSILGYIIGLPAITTLLSVTLGNIVALAAWVWFYDWLHDWNRGLALVLLGLIFAIAIGGILIARIFPNKKAD